MDYKSDYHMRKHNHPTRNKKRKASYINLVPRSRDPFGQQWGSRPLARSNTGSPQFTDFQLLA